MLVNMNDILLPAKENGYGVGFFNAVNVEMARAIIETAEELCAPVMVGTAEVLLPITGRERVAEMVRICHAMGVTVEGELGHVGDNAGAGKLENPSDYFTDPDTAMDFERIQVISEKQTSR